MTNFYNLLYHTHIIAIAASTTWKQSTKLDDLI